MIGAGISGLAAAYEITKRFRESNRALALQVFEASDRTGGVIHTEQAGELTLELGPDSIVTDKPWAAELCREIGLGDDLIPTRQSGGGASIARGDTLLPVPDGLHLMAPSRLMPFATSGLLSVAGKLRVALEPFIPRAQGDRDESLADFVRRRLGKEALERIAQPMVGGIYTADPEKLSLRATMPRFIEMEQRQGSLIRAMVKARRAGTLSARGPRYDLFVSLKNGLGALPERLAELLPTGALQTGCAVRSVRREDPGWEIEVEDSSGPRRESFDGVIVSVPAFAAASMLAEQDASLARELEAIEYASSAIVNLAYRPDQITREISGFGFVVPAIEGRTTLACTFMNRKWEGRAPEETVLLRAFVGGALAPQNVDLEDGALVDAVTRDLAELVGVRGEPRMSSVTRWRQSMPQYHVGHLPRVDRIEAAVSAWQGLELAGNAYRGTGIPDCVRSGRQAAENLVKQLPG